MTIITPSPCGLIVREVSGAARAAKAATVKPATSTSSQRRN